MGYEAARLLARLFEGVRPTEPVLVEPSDLLHIRQSSDVLALKDRNVHRALQYIRTHATEPIKVPQIAEAMGISRKKLELDFARFLGRTPGQAIAVARLEVAKQLLVETHWPTDKIATRSGFGTEPTLRHAFYEYEKMTPGDYRIRFGTV
jgi:LacI family transcriptional regulator